MQRCGEVYQGESAGSFCLSLAVMLGGVRHFDKHLNHIFMWFTRGSLLFLFILQSFIPILPMVRYTVLYFESL